MRKRRLDKAAKNPARGHSLGRLGKWSLHLSVHDHPLTTTLSRRTHLRSRSHELILYKHSNDVLRVWVRT